MSKVVMSELDYVSPSIWKKVVLSHGSDVHSSVEERRQTEPNISMSHPKCGSHLIQVPIPRPVPKQWVYGTHVATSTETLGSG